MLVYRKNIVFNFDNIDNQTYTFNLNAIICILFKFNFAILHFS